MHKHTHCTQSQMETPLRSYTFRLTHHFLSEKPLQQVLHHKAHTHAADLVINILGDHTETTKQDFKEVLPHSRDNSSVCVSVYVSDVHTVCMQSIA